MSRCQEFANSCHGDFDAWSTSRNSFQSSVVDASNSGVMPVTDSYYVMTVTPSTSYEYNTSWIVNRWTSSLLQGSGGTLLVDPKKTHALVTKASASDTGAYGDAVNGDTAIVAFESMTWTASKVSQSVQLGPNIVLASDTTMTTAGKSIWLTDGGRIVVASGTSRTTIGFESASGSAEMQSRTARVTTSASSWSGSASQEDCPDSTSCISESAVGSIVDAATATVTGAGTRSRICRTAWSLTAALGSIVAFLGI
ncbi:uncharacterized protein MYCFIDRAFT_78716 [Pseudocercospora fijiensis CIRAD86]|uniref:Uncharacterized protein n=1 Tax=Pseudocercospora fijiensis (strain CIRAD86) TaxID=383855 RepID=M3AWM1_PSEFD|nr:uncharacterized protein MYCFIDRAFT_78716 [Pseudocercospora fijiensis CIRAD86]EME81857.1 hypothetical protein MYCFIDRAFT_78716 [Pseudocercospora fijiensis CIRAD86]